jgi:2'-5' RNA ligase
MAKQDSEHDERRDARNDSEVARLRLFSAIELPPEVRARAAGFIKALREAAPDTRASWDREEKLHLTLKFFGDVEESRVEQLTAALNRAAARINSFQLNLRGTGVFPLSGLPRVLWLGAVDSSGRLDKLHNQIEEECAHAGFARERKRFHPHLTIARLRHPEGARRLSALHKAMDFETEAFPVKEIVLIKSELLPQGSRYTKLSSHELKETG